MRLILTLLTVFNILKVSSFDENDIDPKTNSIIDVSSNSGFDILDSIFNKITEHLFSLIALILIGVFIYVGYLFITSEGDEAQFKKAWKTFFYVIIGIVIIILSWGAVKLVSSVGV